MRYLIAIGVPILIAETCLFFLTIGSEDPSQYQYCNKTACTYEVSADYANCKNKDLVQIPPQCSSAVYLDLRKNDLQYIGSTSFSKYKNVKYLYLDGNHIRNITPRAFVECTSLQQLFLQNNPIFIIQSEALAGLTDLRHLYLNLADLQIIQLHAFDELKALLRLYLSDNSLESLPSNLFQELQNLEILTLANNRIQSLSSNTFQGLMRLEYLDIKQNSLTLLPNGLFHNMLRLTRLTISFNSIHTIEKGAIDFDHLSNLDTLDMRNNTITSVANFSTDLPSVPNLYLANNLIHCDCHNINGLIIWYELHPGVDGPGTLATCNSPPEFTGRLVRDITLNITLPCEQTPTPPLPDTPPPRTIILKMPYDESTTMLLRDNTGDLVETKRIIPDIMNMDTTTISPDDFKEILARQDDKDTKQINIVKYLGIGIVIATTIIIVVILLLVFKKCKSAYKKKHANSSNQTPNITPTPGERQPENPNPHQTQEEESVYEQVPGSERTTLSNQASPPTTPESPGTDESFPFLPLSPSQALMPQQTPLQLTGYISLPSMAYPHDQQSVQYKPALMHSISEPSPSHLNSDIGNHNAHEQLPDVTHTISQKNNNLVHPYAVQLVGPQTQICQTTMDQNTQMDHNFDTIAAHNHPLPYHPVEAQTPPVPLPDVQQGSCRCPISHLPYTNPFCAQNTMQIQNNPICT